MTNSRLGMWRTSRARRVSVVSVVQERIAGLVGASSQGDLVERTRLETFVVVRLSATAAVLLAAPAWLMFGAPAKPWQVLAFACALAPMGAVFALSRGAPLIVAQVMSVAALFTMALILAFASADARILSFAVLVLATLELSGAAERRLALWGGAVAFAILGMLALTPARDGAPLSQEALGAAIFAMLAYATGLSWAAARVTEVASLRERRARMRHEALAETIGDLVLRHDAAGAVVHASPEANTLFALTPGELMGRGMFEHIHVADRPTFLTTIASALDGDGVTSCVVRLRRGAHGQGAAPDFAWIDIRARRIPLERRSSDPHDNARVVSIVRDVTRARRAEEEISAAKSAFEQANVWKDRFLANVSHELRTPLNAIIGFAEILGNETLAPTDPARAREYANIIHTSGGHLLEMVNSILDMSKIDAGSFDIVPEPFDLPPLLDQCCDMMHLKASTGQVTLVRDYPRRLEELVADKRACKQILINLLSNAVKFTPPGGSVTLGARPEGAMVVFTVADTGIGIDARDLVHIGDPFFQAQRETTRAYEGTGLGLSLVRGLVGLHGGSMSVESAPGQGSTFVVRLPAHCAGPMRGADKTKIETIVRRGSTKSAEFSSTLNPVKKIA